MPFGSGRFVSFGKFPEIPERQEEELRGYAVAADGILEDSVLLNVSKDRNQLILLVDYKKGNDPDSYLDIWVVFSDTVGKIYDDVTIDRLQVASEVGIEPLRFKESGKYRVAIPLCDDKVGIRSQVVGTVTGTEYGVKAVLGVA